MNYLKVAIASSTLSALLLVAWPLTYYAATQSGDRDFAAAVFVTFVAAFFVCTAASAALFVCEAIKRDT